jgi:hypothetical protein
MLLIYDAEQLNPDEEPDPAVLDEYWAVDKAATEAGAMISSQALQPTATATSVRIRDGKTLITDGPFAETKEHLGGYYLLECKDLDEAIGYAKMIPGARTGTVEVRPVMEFDDPDEFDNG